MVSGNMEEVIPESSSLYMYRQQVPVKKKVALFLTVAGSDALDVFNGFQLTQAEKANYESLGQKSGDYCTPYKNETHKRCF